MLSLLQSLSVKNCPLKMATTPSLRNTFGWNTDTLDSRLELASATHSILSAWLPQCSRGCSPLVYMRAKSLQLQPTLCNPTDCSPQTILSMGFSRQECQSQLPYLFQGIVPTQGSNPCLRHLPYWQMGSLPPAPPGHPTLPSQLFKFPHSPQTMNKGILSF